MYYNRVNPSRAYDIFSSLNPQASASQNTNAKSSAQNLIGNYKYGTNTTYDTYTSQKATNGTNTTNSQRAKILTKATPRDYDEYWKKLESQQTSIPRKYTGPLTADQIAKKFANGDKISNEEYYYMLKGIGIGDKYNATVTKRVQTSEEKNLSTILKKYKIELDPSEELKISVDTQKKVTVSGIEDTEKLKKIQDALNSEPNELSSLFAISSKTYKKLSSDFTSVAQCSGLAEQYLNEHTDGKVSITDLKIQNGKIIGLPASLNTLLNKPVTSYNPDIPAQSKAYEAKLAIVNVLAYMKVNGSDDLPNIDSTLSYKNDKLSCVEQPELAEEHPETSNSLDFTNKTILLQNNPMLYYQSVVNSSHKR